MARGSTSAPARCSAPPLDAAIDGKGYFVVQTPRGQRYTRNGAFGLNANFQPTDHDIIISTTGVVSARDGSGTLSVQRGQLQLVDFDNAQQLQKDGASTFQAPPNANQKPIAPGTRIVQGSIEKSNVRPILEMTRMIEITRSYSDIAAILQQQGDLRRNSLQQLSQAAGTSG